MYNIIATSFPRIVTSFSVTNNVFFLYIYKTSKGIGDCILRISHTVGLILFSQIIVVFLTARSTFPSHFPIVLQRSNDCQVNRCDDGEHLVNNCQCSKVDFNKKK